MMAVLVKAVAGVYASSVQGQMGGEVGSDLRLRALDVPLSVSSGVPSATWRSGGALHAPRDALALSAPTEHGYKSSSMQLRDRSRRTVDLRGASDRATRRADVVVRVDPYGPTFFAPVTKYSVSAKHEEGTLLCCS
jgi:hypothetical protein